MICNCEAVYYLFIRIMLDIIELNLKSWDWKGQTIWSKETWEVWHPVSVILNRIESWYYQTKEVEMNIETLSLTNYSFTTNDLYDFITHYKLVENADLSYPIILNRRGEIVDWRHRLVKAILKWDKTIKWIMVLDSDIY